MGKGIIEIPRKFLILSYTRNNKIKHVPKIMENMFWLKEIDIGSNKLNHIPEPIIGKSWYKKKYNRTMG